MNFIERELDWSGAERVAGFGRVNSSDGWKKGMMVAYKGWLWNRTDKEDKWTMDFWKFYAARYKDETCVVR